MMISDPKLQGPTFALAPVMLGVGWVMLVQLVVANIVRHLNTIRPKKAVVAPAPAPAANGAKPSVESVGKPEGAAAKRVGISLGDVGALALSQKKDGAKATPLPARLSRLSTDSVNSVRSWDSGENHGNSDSPAGTGTPAGLSRAASPTVDAAVPQAATPALSARWQLLGARGKAMV
jgi:hypothetical protein